MSSQTPKHVFKLAVAANMRRLRRLVGAPEMGRDLFQHPLPQDEFLPHRLLASTMHRIGFDVRSVKRYDAPPVWRLKLRRGHVRKGREATGVAASLGHFLSVRCAPCPAEDLLPLIEGDQITITFVWQVGAPGTLSFGANHETIFFNAEESL